MFLKSWYEQYKEFSIAWRAKYFRPVLKFLAAGKITPNQITVGRLIFLAPLAYCFYLENLWGVLLFYSLFWFFDLLDGSLARYLNISNDKGRFLDTVVDNFSYGVLVVGFIYLQSAPLWLLVGNIFLEYLVQILAIIKKQKQYKSDWLFKAQADVPYFKSATHSALLFFVFGLDFLYPVFYIVNIGLLVAVAYYSFPAKNKK